MSSKLLVRGAFLVAVAIILQAVRLVIPLPPLLTTFIIGTLVNMMLALCVRLNGFISAVILSVLLPVFAYFQGQLLLPFLIPVVALGNVLFSYCVKMYPQGVLAYCLPPLVKAISMGGAAYLALTFFGIGGEAVRKGVLFAMSVPQLVTGVMGILAAEKMYTILKKRL